MKRNKARLYVKEVAERYSLNRYEIGRKAGLSSPTMDKIWLRPHDLRVRLDTLDRLAEALTQLINEMEPQQHAMITVLDLIVVVVNEVNSGSYTLLVKLT